MEAVGMIFDAVWQLLSIPFQVSETISFNLWQFFLAVIVIAIIVNLIFKKKVSE